MPFRIDIGDPKSKKTFHLESASEAFVGKKLGDKIEGKIIKEFSDLGDYEFIVTGASDNAGFPAVNELDGAIRKRLLLTRGHSMNIKKPQGLRLRRLVRGNTIAEDIAQINLKVSKEGSKPLTEIFKKEEKAAEKVEEKK